MKPSPENILAVYLRHTNKTHFAFDNTQIQTIPNPKPGREYVLYVHVPFCESLCPYCSFNRFLFEKKQASAYFSQLRDEMRLVANLGYDFHSMYVGGGTPTILVDELCETIDLARHLFNINEVSCETNPNHLTPEIVDRLETRVQRLSVGVQSFDNNLLRQMCRYDRFGSGEEIYARLQEVAHRFQFINVDMIYNFPGQTEANLRRDLERVLASGTSQTTFYPLMSSPAVARSLARTVGKVKLTSEAHFYNLIFDQLSRSFDPISAWTFSRKGNAMIDEYIVDHDEYVGIGPGAFSYLDGTLYVNTFSLRGYKQALANGRFSVSAMRQFGLSDQMRYRFMMELFSLKLDKRRFQETYGVAVERALWKEMTFMRLCGAFASEDNDQLCLSPKGRYLLVVMMREFFSGVNQVRDQARQSLPPDERLLI